MLLLTKGNDAIVLVCVCVGGGRARGYCYFHNCL